MLMYEAFRDARPRRRARMAFLGIGALALATLGAALPAFARPRQDTKSALVEVLASGRKGTELKNIVEHTQARLVFAKDFSERIAIGSEDIAKVERIVSKREILLSAMKVGTTSLMVWFADGSVEQYMFSVTRDLTILESALREISPTIRVEIAPDRDAVVLTGTVPTREAYFDAQKAAADYLSAGTQNKRAKDDSAKKPVDTEAALTAQGQVINRLRITAATLLEKIIESASKDLGAKDARVQRIRHGDRDDDQYDQFVIYGTVSDRGIRDEVLVKADQIVRRFDPEDGKKPVRTTEEASAFKHTSITEYSQAPERIHDRMSILVPAVNDPGVQAPRKPAIVERMEEALRVVGCDTSDVHADVIEGLGESGVLVLNGTVPDQTCLMRILTIAARLVGGESESDMGIKVIGDESGALSSDQNKQNQFGSGVSEIFAGAGSRSSGSGAAQLLNNRLSSNIARAKAIQLAGGKILSFLRVVDIPQVRIDIKLYEINRNALLSWQPNSQFGPADFAQNGINPNRTVDLTGHPNGGPDGHPDVNADGEVILQSDGIDARGLFGFLGGGFSGLAQIGGDRIRINMLLDLLENEGIARTLSRPSLTVLSGEQAFFGVGGSIPIQQQTLTSFGNGAASSSTSGILSGTEFRDFGIRLSVRPLVDENGFVTVDVVPTISNPDADLTTLVRASTGTNPQTVAFQERSLRTSARLRDGQLLLIGGLIEHSRIDDASQTPWLHKVPLVGWLFKGFNYADSDRELVIVVSPVIVRDAPARRSMWAFPEASELMPRPPPPAAATPAVVVEKK